MIYGLGTVSLSDVTFGTLNTGIVPHGNLIRTSAWDRNLAPVTVLGADTDIVVGTSLTVTANDLVLVFASLYMLKGAPAGMSYARVMLHAGTATLVFLGNRTYVANRIPSQPAGGIWETTIATMVRVTGSGTMALKLTGWSNGSNGAVAIDEGQLGVWALYGS